MGDISVFYGANIFSFDALRLEINPRMKVIIAQFSEIPAQQYRDVDRAAKRLRRNGKPCETQTDEQHFLPFIHLPTLLLYKKVIGAKVIKTPQIGRAHV